MDMFNREGEERRMEKPTSRADTGLPALADPGLMMLGPLTLVRLWADMGRAATSVMPASLLITASPFFWAPPVWVGALMAGHGGKPAAAPRRPVGR